ncbi:hypothetical protein FGL86_09565 [Pistricoccus aurantiacus]|uniref:PelD GGDEF domain-containing protein n=1 Tax=Pistricoccus aurantiacus TaxID=1883414 RepID=A0A5B8STP7_9GAMM|nr:PelD GGDEF domain-containing protein [Pistricoccus aurantiacus]QEA39297.1 hypothetical protein FGL86_09565 [Pistricoccus aurantiacus]
MNKDTNSATQEEARRAFSVDGTMITRASDIKVEPPSHSKRLLETLLIGLGVPALGFLFSPQDPLLIELGAPWLLMAGPVLMGSLHGSLYGVIAALLAIALMVVVQSGLHIVGLSVFRGVIAIHAIALLMLGLGCGELTTRLRCKLRQLSLLATTQDLRQEAFLRHYHLLRVSHDQLTEQMASKPFTLRDTLTRLTRNLAERVQRDTDERVSLERLGDEILSFIGQHSRVQQAALLPVDAEGKLTAPVAWLGAPSELDLSDTLLQECLHRGQLVGLNDFLEAEANTPLCAVPLVDIREHVHGVVAVMDIPFVDFHDGQLQLLSVIGAHLGDLFSARSDDDDDLEESLEIWIKHAHRDHLTSTIVSVTLPEALGERYGPQVARLIDKQRRGLDRSWDIRLDSGRRRFIVLMPLADIHSLTPFRARLTPPLESLFEQDELPRGVTFSSLVIDGDRSAELLLDTLHSDEMRYATS